MDRMAQTALNSLKMLMENQTATSHNLSNLSTPGFRQDVVTDFVWNNSLVVSGDKNGYLSIWDINSGDSIKKVQAHKVTIF